MLVATEPGALVLGWDKEWLAEYRDKVTVWDIGLWYWSSSGAAICGAAL